MSHVLINILGTISDACAQPAATHAAAADDDDTRGP